MNLPFPISVLLGIWLQVSAEQLCFFKFPRPLLERFGKDFFKAVPRHAGVYVFSGESGRALYVGHSGNLRDRLSYYKNAQPEREPRRIIRLVHQVRDITLECCDSLDVAQVRELALIRQLRPKFNIANTLSPTYSYFAFTDREESFELRLRMSEARADGESIIGGFRNRGLCARALLAIARATWTAERSLCSVYDFPAGLNYRTSIWRLPREWRDSVWELISGEGESLLALSAALIEKANDPFLRLVFETDFITLTEFSQLARAMLNMRIDRECVVLSQEALQVSSRLTPRGVGVQVGSDMKFGQV